MVKLSTNLNEHYYTKNEIQGLLQNIGGVSIEYFIVGSGQNYILFQKYGETIYGYYKLNNTTVTSKIPYNILSIINPNFKVGEGSISFNQNIVTINNASGEGTFTLPIVDEKLYSYSILCDEHITMLYHDGTSINVQAINENNSPVQDASVLFTLNGVLYFKKTNSEGMANLRITLRPGNYESTVIAGTIKTISIEVNSTILISQNDGTILSFYTLKSNAEYLTNESVTINLKGQNYTIISGADDGYCEFEIPSGVNVGDIATILTSVEQRGVTIGKDNY